MAGLLDFFGSGNAETLGLLGLSPEDIQKKQKDAQADALFALAGSLFKGGKVAPSILQGLQQGSQAYQNTMQAGLQQQLQNAQLQEMLRKREQEKQSLAEQKRIQNIIGQSVTPEQVTFQGQPSQFPARDEEGNMMPDMGIRPAGIDLARIAPQLMGSVEGRKSLGELLAAQKSMRPETFSLSENAVQFERDPFTGETKTIAQGAKKKETVTVGNSVLDKETMKVLYTAPDAPAASIKEFQDFSKLTPTQQKAYLLLQEQKRPTTTINMPSEGERKSAVLASRLNFSVGQMNDAIGADPKSAMPNTAAEVARFVSRTDFLPNKINTTQRQIVETAQLDILDAALTLGTGAAYTREQLESYRRAYFPQLEDNPATVKSKQDRLINLLKSAELGAGRAAKDITVPVPKVPTTPVQPEKTSPFQYDADKEQRYQNWVTQQGKKG